MTTTPPDAAALADDESIARLFHDTYERLAPSFGYETRPDTKAFDPTTPNGRLMIAVCGQVAAAIRSATSPDSGLVTRLTAYANGLRGSMWANRTEAIKLLDEAAAALAQTPAIEAAALERAAKVAEDHAREASFGEKFFAQAHARNIAAEIRALGAAK